jgi:hypothetical protein
MHSRKESLQPFEAFLALDWEQVGLVAASCLMPASCNQSRIVRDILLSHELKACFFEETLIGSRRHEEKQADGAAHRQFVIGHWPRDHDWIGEDGPVPSAENAARFPEHSEAIGKMVHRIDTENRVEALVVEG